MAQQLTKQSTQRTEVRFPAPVKGRSQRPVTPAPGDLMPLLAFPRVGGNDGSDGGAEP